MASWEMPIQNGKPSENQRKIWKMPELHGRMKPGKPICKWDMFQPCLSRVCLHGYPLSCQTWSASCFSATYFFSSCSGCRSGTKNTKETTSFPTFFPGNLNLVLMLDDFISLDHLQIGLFCAAIVPGLVQSKDWHRMDMCSPNILPFLGYAKFQREQTW